MKKALLGAAGLTVGLFALQPVQAATEFNASVWFPDTHPLTRAGYLAWAEKLEEASGGDLKPTVFTGTSLLPPNAHLTGLQDGIAQVTYHAGTYTPTDLPEDNVLAILGLGLRDTMVTAFAVTDFYINDPAMQARFKELGIVFVGGYSSPQYVLHCSTEVKELSDLEGLKIRMPGPVHAEYARSVGAVPVNVPSSEMFTGLERGQLDCAANAANDLKSRSLWDVAKYTTLLPLGGYFAGWEWAYNAGFWQELTPEQRRTILDVTADALVDMEVDYEAATAEALAEAPDHGSTVHEATPEMLKSVNAFAADVGREMAIKEGSERFELEDPAGLIERFEATVAKWEKLLEGVDPTDAAALKTIVSENIYGKVDETAYGL